MNCKLPSCYPTSVETFNNLENFENSICPTGYILYSSPNGDCQDVHDPSPTPTLFYVASTDSKGTNPLPDPSMGNGIVGWSVIVHGEGNTPVTTKVATHSIASGSPGFKGGNNCNGINPHQLTFVDVASVQGIASYGNHGMSYCILPPPSTPSGVTITNIGPGTFTATWTPGTGQTSYTYTLNGDPITPQSDNGMAKSSAIFTNVPGNNSNTLVVNAVNLSGSVSSAPSASFSIESVTTPPSNVAGVSIVFSANSESNSNSNSQIMLYAGIGGVILIIFILMLMMGGKK